MVVGSRGRRAVLVGQSSLIAGLRFIARTAQWVCSPTLGLARSKPASIYIYAYIIHLSYTRSVLKKS